MTKSIVVLYYSGSGNTHAIADHIAEVFSQLNPSGMQLELMDAKELDVETLKTASGYVIGTPNYFSAPSGYVKVFFDELFPDRGILSGRPVWCFVSHGGSGDIEHLRTMCNWLELKTVGPTVVIRGKNITSSDATTIKDNLKKMITER